MLANGKPAQDAQPINGEQQPSEHSWLLSDCSVLQRSSLHLSLMNKGITDNTKTYKVSITAKGFTD